MSETVTAIVPCDHPDHAADPIYVGHVDILARYCPADDPHTGARVVELTVEKRHEPRVRVRNIEAPARTLQRWVSEWEDGEDHE